MLLTNACAQGSALDSNAMETAKRLRQQKCAGKSSQSLPCDICWEDSFLKVPDFIGAPEGIRTPDPQIRSLVLYPAELPAPWRKGWHARRDSNSLWTLPAVAAILTYWPVQLADRHISYQATKDEGFLSGSDARTL
jgi:hypothetical protein